MDTDRERYANFLSQEITYHAISLGGSLKAFLNEIEQHARYGQITLDIALRSASDRQLVAIADALKVEAGPDGRLLTALKAHSQWRDTDDATTEALSLSHRGFRIVMETS